MTKSRLIGAVLALVLIASCQLPVALGPRAQGVRFTLTVTQPSLASASSRLLLANATSVTITVVSEGVVEEQRTVPRLSSQVTVEFSLVPLKEYTLTAVATGTDGTILFSGETTVTMTASDKATLDLLPVATPKAFLLAAAQPAGGAMGSLGALAPGEMAHYRVDFGSTGSAFGFVPPPAGVELHVQKPDGGRIALGSGGVLLKTDLGAASVAWVTYFNAGTTTSAALPILGVFDIPVTALSVSGPTDLAWGGTGDLTVTAIPPNANKQSLSDLVFTSSDTGLIVVDALGHLTAQSADGDASIIVQWKDNPGQVKATHVVKVSKIPLPVVPTKNTLTAANQVVGSGMGVLDALAPGEQAHFLVDLGATATDFAFVTPPTNVKLSLQNPDGTTILLAADRVLRRSNLKSGTVAWVTFENTGASAAPTLATVGTFTIPVASLGLSGPADLFWGQSGDLTVTPVPANANKQTLADFTFTSDDDTLVKVDASGHLTAQTKDGQTQIVVRWKDDPTQVYAAHLVRSSEIVLTGLTVTQGTTSLATGSTLTLTALPTPLDASRPGFTWSSSAPSLASVDPITGLVTSLFPGTATITATSTAFPGIAASVVVTLTPTKFLLDSNPGLSLTTAPNQTIALAGTADRLWALGADQSVRSLNAGLWETVATIPAVPSASVKWLAAAADGTLFAASATTLYQFDGTGGWTVVTPPPSGVSGLAVADGVLWASSSNGFLWSWQGGVWQKGPGLPTGFVALGGGQRLMALGTQVMTLNGAVWDPSGPAPAQAVSLTFAYQSILILVVR